MTTRREFLGVTATVGLGTVLPWQVAGASPPAADAVPAGAAPLAALPGVSPPLPKFVDLLPKPGVVTATGKMFPPMFSADGREVLFDETTKALILDTTQPMIDVYEVHLSQFGQRLTNSALFAAPTQVWGYNNSFPGPTIEARRGTPFYVRWINDLPATHLLSTSIDPMMHGVAGNPEVRTVTHLHGGHVPWRSDGGPDGWYANNPDGSLAAVGPLFNGDTYYYPNVQQAATTWYHDHAMGITRLNVYAGLAGFFLMRDDHEDSLGLPKDAQEIPIAIQDRTFNPDGSLFYPPPPHVPEFFGDTMVVNGVVWPRLVVETKRYRFRFLNGCTARFMRMQLVRSDKNGTAPTSASQITPGPVFQQIGTDLGLLPAPVPMQILTMGPGERCDVVVDFTNALRNNNRNKPDQVAYYLLYNDAGTPFSNTASTKGAIPQVMLFEVRPATTADNSLPLPATLNALPVLGAPTKPPRWLTLEEMAMGGGLIALLNGAYYSDPVTETPQIDDTEVWEIINLTPDTHPIHLHQTDYQILNREAIDVRGYMRSRATSPVWPADPTNFLSGTIIPPDPNELGVKDTIRANPGEVTRIKMKWTGWTGTYVWHCHILEHEDHEMMRPLKVLAPPPALADG